MSLVHRQSMQGSRPVQESDMALLERWKQGEQQAFEALFTRYYERIYRVLYNLVEQRETAEDLAQETFLALYHHPPHLSWNDETQGSGLVAWLSRVALNRGYNELRREQRSQQRIGRWQWASPVSHDPSDMAMRAEERSQVQAVLADMPERQRSLLLLRYAGLSYAEIAGTLQIAPSSVGTLLARAERAFGTRYQETACQSTSGIEVV
ncbi:MAG: sigma-70 family RNA polymerase sigma factor [Chloroflexaceae bacterium]|nr:sigma-70 family RNA polymerase sigma factor [Chloroflexaceae bacterium]